MHGIGGLGRAAAVWLAVAVALAGYAASGPIPTNSSEKPLLIPVQACELLSQSAPADADPGPAFSVKVFSSAMDILIAVAYFSIPLEMLYYLRNASTPVPFPNLLLLFCSFICLCGFTHAVGSWQAYHVTYTLAALVKMATAVISIYTAYVIALLLPAALQLPLYTQSMEHRIAQQNLAEHALRRERIVMVLFRQLTQMIRRSLDRGEILRTAVSEIQKTTGATHCIMLHRWHSSVLMEADVPLVRQLARQMAAAAGAIAAADPQDSSDGPPTAVISGVGMPPSPQCSTVGADGGSHSFEVLGLANQEECVDHGGGRAAGVMPLQIPTIGARLEEFNAIFGPQAARTAAELDCGLPTWQEAFWGVFSTTSRALVLPIRYGNGTTAWLVAVFDGIRFSGSHTTEADCAEHTRAASADVPEKAPEAKSLWQRIAKRVRGWRSGSYSELASVSGHSILSGAGARGRTLS